MVRLKSRQYAVTAAVATASAMACGCIGPVPEAPPPPTTVTRAYAPTTLNVLKIDFPVVTGGERAAEVTKATGASGSGNSTGQTDAAPVTSAPAAVPAVVPARGGGHGGGGTVSTTLTEGITFAGYLDHPTYAGGSGRTAVVATEGQLRAAVADATITNIDLSANIDLRTDGTTPDLEVARVVSISGRSSYCIAGDLVAVTADDVSFNDLTMQGLVEVRGVDDVQLRSCLLGTLTTDTAVKVAGGIGTTLTGCTVKASGLGIEVTSGAVVEVSVCDVTADYGLRAVGATVSLLAGTFHTALLGLEGRSATVEVEQTRFEGTAVAMQFSATSTGHSAVIDDVTVAGLYTAVIASGAVPIDLTIRDSRFSGTTEAIKINYAVNTWDATIAGNTFSAAGVTARGIKVDRASATAGLPAAWRAANTFLGYGAGLDVVSP